MLSLPGQPRWVDQVVQADGCRLDKDRAHNKPEEIRSKYAVATRKGIKEMLK